MLWIWILLAVASAAALGAALFAVRHGGDGSVEEVSPLFVAGIAICGASVALATTIGPFMFAMSGAGLVMMFVGGRHQHTG